MVDRQFYKGENYRTLLLLFLLGSLSCNQPDIPPEKTNVSATLRYQAASKTYEVDLVFSDSLITTPPTFLGSALTALTPRHYRTRRTLAEFAPPSIGLPSGGSTVPSQITGPLQHAGNVPVYIDSLPSEIDKFTGISFAAAATGLTDDESLIVFFEPTDRSSPRRVLVAGPTASGRVTLPAAALSEVNPGTYEVYLIRQGLYRQSEETYDFRLQYEYFTRSKAVSVVPSRF